MFAIAIAIFATSPGPIIYKGRRTGLRGKPFLILKFRTMVETAEMGAGTTSRNDDRITPLGGTLRKYKLDELPQLVNVLMGQMSFVGPRPELPRYTDGYTPTEEVILEVKPGITDLSSIAFSDLGSLIDDDDPDHSFETRVLPEKNRLRVRYAKERSLLLDLEILARTALLLLMRPFKRYSA